MYKTSKVRNKVEKNFTIMCVISRLLRCNVIFAATVHHNRSLSRICFYTAPLRFPSCKNQFSA